MRPSEIIRAQQDIIRQQDGMISTLKAALSLAGVVSVPSMDVPWLSGLTRQEASLVGVLYTAFPHATSRMDIIDHLPGNDHARERQLQLVDIVVHKIRKKLGQSAIEAERGVGFKMSESFHRSIPKDFLGENNG
jgi:DNA-binding response OmpR family regulator